MPDYQYRVEAEYEAVARTLSAFPNTGLYKLSELELAESPANRHSHDPHVIEKVAPPVSME